PHLELLAGGLVHVGRAQHRPAVDDRGQEHGAGDAGARPTHRLHDLPHGAVEEMVIVGLEADADLLVGADRDHVATPRSPRRRRRPPGPPPRASRTAAPCPSPPAGSTRSSSSRCPPASPSPPHSAACTPPSRPSSGNKTAAGTR